MGILQIAPVTLAGLRLMINIVGESATGKTLTALLLAAGIEPDPNKRGLLDTEGGQRGRAYMSQIPGGYLYAPMKGPYTPERYIEAISDYEAYGATTLVIDSGSHAWEAEGGVLEMVESSDLQNDMAKWKGPKRRLGKMHRRMMSSDMNIIICSRAKRPMLEVYKDINGKKKKTYEEGPVKAIQDKALRFDMMIVALMLGDGKFTVTEPEGKCPGMLREIFAGTERMSIDTGKKLAAWCGAQNTKSAEQRELEVAVAEIAEKGFEILKAHWKDVLTEEQRAMLRPIKDDLMSMARAADAERERLRVEEEKERKQREADVVAQGGPGAATASEQATKTTIETPSWPAVLPPKPADAAKWGEWLMALKVKILAAKEPVDVDELSQAIKATGTTIPGGYDGEIKRALADRLKQLG